MASVAQNNAFVSNLLPQYPLDDALDWINKNLDPDEVFDDKKLEEWAGSNGYVLSEN